MANLTESTVHVPDFDGSAAVRDVLNNALVQCWRILERLFTRTDAPYY
jgi:hypothetical protein